MPISAFSDEGLLKKNALQGTSLESDPDREASRRRFESLHEEARAGNLNQEQMQSRLAGRFQQFGNAQNERLAQIAQEQQTMLGEAKNLRNPENQKRFAQYQGGAMNKEFRQQSKEEWKEESGEHLPKRRKKNTVPQQKAFEAYLIRKYGNYGAWGKAARKADDQDDWKLYRDKQNRKNSRKYRQASWKEQYGNVAFRSNEQRISDEVDRINEKFLPNQQEAGERRARLQDRMELYNMFLGE